MPESNKNPGQPVSWAATFMKQLAKFPVAAHDDYVDTWSQAIIYLKDDGWFELPVVKEYPEEDIPIKASRNPYT